MRIDHLTIRNFRCFRKQDFTFQPQFNVLIGENGSGKTATLDALAVAASSWLRGFRGLAARTIRREDARLVSHESNGSITFEDQYPVTITAEGEVSGETISWQRIMTAPTKRTIKGPITAMSARIDEQVQAGQEVVLPLLAHYGSGRLWLDSSTSENKRSAKTGREAQLSLSRLEGYRTNLDNRVNSRELADWVERCDRIAYQESREPAIYTIVKDAMSRMLEGAEAVYFDNRRLEIVVRFQNRGPVPFSYLSDGQRSMLALTGDLAMRMARLNPHLGLNALIETPGIVLIDELDLHLHPNWQRHVVEDLRNIFPEIQFIASTHSPFIVQTLREGELIPLEQQPVPDTANLGIEEIARGLMGVENPEVSPRYREMVDTAKSYLEILETAAKAPEEKLASSKDALASKIAPYADNPAFQAFLEMERVATLGE